MMKSVVHTSSLSLSSFLSEHSDWVNVELPNDYGLESDDEESVASTPSVTATFLYTIPNYPTATDDEEIYPLDVRELANDHVIPDLSGSYESQEEPQNTCTVNHDEDYSETCSIDIRDLAMDETIQDLINSFNEEEVVTRIETNGIEDCRAEQVLVTHQVTPLSTTLESTEESQRSEEDEHEEELSQNISTSKQEEPSLKNIFPFVFGACVSFAMLAGALLIESNSNSREENIMRYKSHRQKQG